jgi:hypothetical protein
LHDGNDFLRNDVPNQTTGIVGRVALRHQALIGAAGFRWVVIPQLLLDDGEDRLAQGGVRRWSPRDALGWDSAVGRRWRVDETYVKTGQRWHELYRAINEQGQIVDGSLSARRNIAAAHAFFKGPIQTSKVAPTRVTTD